MSNSRRLALLLCLAFLPLRALAYDDAVVHPRMTGLAFDRALAAQDFLSPLGLTSASVIQGKTPRQWAEFGSTKEDAFPNPLVHFLDPLHDDSALVVYNHFCIPRIYAPLDAKSWALDESTNEFGLFAARFQRRLALVGFTEQTRQENLAKLFRSAGQLAHLVQDMSQPQHTRNDVHLTVAGLPVPQYLDDETYSRYELWCANNLGAPSASTYFDSYPLTRFGSYDAYFNSPGKLGLADYSNWNFVTEDTNYSDRVCGPFSYDFPLLVNTDARDETHVITTYHWNAATSTMEVATTEYEDVVLSSPVWDRYTDFVEINDKHSFYSYFDYELKEHHSQRLYSLPESALASQAHFLVRRSVGYSGGLIRHFFRGQITAAWTKKGNGKYDVTIRNAGAHPISGQLTLYYRVATPGTEGAPAGGDLALISDPAIPAVVNLGANGQGNDAVTISDLNHPPAIPAGQSLLSRERRIAIYGMLGTEPGETVGLVQPGLVAPAFRIEVNWSGWSTGYLRMHEHPPLPSTNFRIAYLFFNGQSFNFGWLTPLTFTPSVNLTEGPMSVSIDRALPGYRYEFFVVGPQSKPVDVKTFVNGAPFQDWSIVLTPSSPSNPNFPWPTGDGWRLGQWP